MRGTQKPIQALQPSIFATHVTRTALQRTLTATIIDTGKADARQRLGPGLASTHYLAATGASTGP